MEKCMTCESNVVRCKGLCARCYGKKQYEKHRAAKLLYQKEYYHLNKESIIAYQRQYNAARHEHISHRTQTYHQTHLDEAKQYRESNAPAITNQINKWHDEHPQIRFCDKTITLTHHRRPPIGYVYHHTLYDHADPEANIVLLSRSSHAQGHALLKKLGIDIEHINME
jgi:hypothetical protein